MINTIKDKEFLAKFVSWYNTKNYNININNFILLDTIFHLQVIHQFINDIYNRAVHFDGYSIVIFIVNVELDVNLILANWNKSGKFTNVIYTEYDLEYLDNTKAFERAINKAIEIITNPF